MTAEEGKPNLDGERPANQRTSFSRFVWLAPSKLLIGITRLYQIAISPLFGPTCRFHPTCSEYFLQSVKKYGAFRGGWRGMRRILRCHPWNPGGFDPP